MNPLNRLLCVLCLTVCVQLVWAQELTPEQTKLYHKIASQTRCVTCQNQSIAESNAPIAKAMQAYIQDHIRAGLSEEAIEQVLVERYGDYVTYKPPVQGNTLGLWIGPLVFLFLAFSLFAKKLKKVV